ncbi:hypothetical protein EMCRGX_G014359 [Ephydatia muelleri]
MDKLENQLRIVVDVIRVELPEVKKVTCIRTICDAMAQHVNKDLLSELNGEEPHGDRGGATWGQRRRSHMGTEEEEPHGDRGGGATWGQRRRSHMGTEEEEPHGDRGGGATWGQRRRSHMGTEEEPHGDRGATWRQRSHMGTEEEPHGD